MPKVDNDKIFTGKPTQAELAQAFQAGFDDESDQVRAIRLHLMSQFDKRLIEQNNSSIEDMLNGRVRGDGSWVTLIFARWNALLGFRCFGS